MRVKINERGLWIPSELARLALGGSGEAEVLAEPGRLLITPAGEAGSEKDPILRLGRNPVRTGVRDGSVNHDRHLYGG